MNKQILFLVTVLTFYFSILTFNCLAQVPAWLWARGSTAVSGGSEASAVAVDASGNTYMAGEFTTSVTFGTDTLSNVGPGNIFLTKYNAAGNVLWAKRASGTFYDNAWAASVAIDTAGNVYMAGYFNSPSFSFDAITLTNTDNSGNSSDIFLAKYDANGNVLWAKSFGGTLTDQATSIVVDVSGNIYMAGFFNSSTITFDAIMLTNNHIFGTYLSDAFLAKYDANGNVLWAKSAGGTASEQATSIGVDTSGNAYLEGWFTSDTLVFGSDTLTTTEYGTSILFLAKYDINGNVVWAKSAGCVGGSWVSASVAVNASGNAYVAGIFHSLTIIFGSDTLTNTNTDNSTDILLAKYDANGNVLWAKNAKGMGNDYASSVAVDILGNAYVTGYFDSQTLTFGPTTLTNTYYTANYTDLFIAKYNENGDIMWAKSAGGAKSDNAYSVALDALGNAYLAGWFNSPTITFDTITLASSVGSYFLVKLKDTLVITTGSESIYKENGINIFPNPAINKITIENIQQTAPTTANIEISNIEGQLIKTFTTNENKTSIDVSALPSGVYFVKVKNEKCLEVRKFVKE